MRLVSSFLTFGFIGLLATVGCGKKSDGGGEAPASSAAAPTAKLEVGIAATGYRASSTSLDAPAPVDASDLSSPPFKATSILSGAPAELTLFVRKITLLGKSPTGAMTNVVVFDDAKGKPVRVLGAQVDLSELFKVEQCYTFAGKPVPLKAGESCECGLDAKGKLVKKVEATDPETGKKVMSCDLKNTKAPPVGVLEVAAGSYDTLQIEYARDAYMSGCLSGYFRSSAAGVGDTSIPHTYCTRANGEISDGSSATLATFEGLAAQTMEVPLSGLSADGFNESQKFFGYTYPIGETIKLEPNKAQRITLLIDANRLLRFETAVRDDAKPIKSGWPKSRPHFFGTTFGASTFVFVGEPGEIRGYKWTADACEGESCSGNNQSFYLEGWLTTIARKGAEPFLLNFMPDDDATLTTIKGSNLTTKQSSQGGVTQTALPDFFKTASNGSVTMKYALDAGKGQVTVESLPANVGDTSDGTFEGFQSLSGPFTLERKL
jgi:hypothetical protein